MSTVKIGNNTKSRIAKLGNFGQTYEEVLNELLDYVEKNPHFKPKLSKEKIIA